MLVWQAHRRYVYSVMETLKILCAKNTFIYRSMVETLMVCDSVLSAPLLVEWWKH